MSDQSPLMAAATAQYDAYRLDELPRALQRDSLDYYYLSVYPSLAEMRVFGPGDGPPYPATVANAYIHVPFCSGVCDFCSYYLVAVNPQRRAAIRRYLEQLKAEFDFHAHHTTLDITYLYFGGGTPSLIPPDALDGLLSFLSDRRYLNRGALGTLELHPEFFADEAAATRFLDTLKHYGIGRVSVGYQVSDETLLRDTKRRHAASFLNKAMALLRARGFLVNLDLMYGLAGQSLGSWETTLADAIAFAPDSISTYFLFVNQGTGLHERVRRGRVSLPAHRHLQTQHIMAQLALSAAGYHELPNDFWARGTGDPATFRPERLPSATVTLPTGPGAYGYYGHTQLANVFDLAEYERRMADGRSPLWRGRHLSAEESLHRDVMFSLKNDPFIDCSLFRTAYNTGPLERFPAIFEKLVALDLVEVSGERIYLTPKGRLGVEEIAGLFRHPAIRAVEDEPGATALLAKHNFAPTYPSVVW
ncbi:MAG: radical SAM protein [Anaerolineae bacterium]|uniref:coproporphyrinogen-III oxidase family protein n=1 Tax=Promineifilum sp. TaxID=2664178 RepID=UPI001D6513AF|nr:radical SAM protein [Anaerolineales bacterium]MCO5180800.1 radical SAM protein [Promineifilum sp.]MCW5845999.1 radical SAM protein [Anaerolineae bacterium]